ncbi:cytochrome c family protein [Geomonas oryzisoli]|uniref:Cytochrome c family protein n=1 Tax=Geomonas oryzisoli TaxID=2847992 RepID=A0ABX8J8F3_9BACT|nr:cytochrome c3 family protein [Geomonas oryzisoli]QWV94311.1 cytochrome c family protein [Geomonas oryzisoli]
MLLKSLVFLILTTLLVAGCGGGSADNTTGVSKLAQSQKCMDASCHGGSVSPGTGALIVKEWLNSTHNLNNGAGCADCHEPHPGHPESCSKCHGGGSGVATQNPDAAHKCNKCHGLAHPDDIQVRLAPQHFGNMTASINNNTYRASYLSSNYIGNCRKCHNPHDPTTAMAANAEWAESGHGDVLSGARTRYEFKTRGSYVPYNLTYEYYCVRCHTSTGYINFVTSGFTDVRPFAGPGYAVVQNAPVKVAAGAAQPADAPSPDKTKEVTACNVCHDNGAGRAYNWATRAVGAYRGYYNFSSSNSSPTVKLNNKVTVYPDVNDSNVCIPCHSGRAIGSMIYDAQAAGMDFSNTNTPSAHDRAAATLVFRTGGYEFQGRNYVPARFLHNRIGVANEHGTGNAGPCATCHMKTPTPHGFQPVQRDRAGNIISIASTACAHCHNGDPLLLTPAVLQAKKQGYAAAIAMLNVLKTDPTLPANSLNPSRSKVRPLANRNSDYNAAFPGGGANTMGAFYNASLLQNEPCAFAHNPQYTKRLIYDSIDWLNNGVMDNDVEAAINNATLAVNSNTGKVSLSNPIMGGYYITAQLPGPAYAAVFAQVKADAINWLLGGPNGGRP